MKYLYILLLSFLAMSIGYSQSYFQIEAEAPDYLKKHSEIEQRPEKFSTFSLDYDLLQNYLMKAPIEKTDNSSDFVFSLPLPNGETADFYIYEAPVMADGLSARYPHIKSYKGFSADGRMVARFDLGPYGFHASVRTTKGEIYIDPYVRGDKNYVISYYLNDLKFDNPRQFACGVDVEAVHPMRLGNLSQNKINKSSSIDLHQYRFALACTGKWGSIRGSVDQALADMNTSTNRLNLIFENEAAVRLVLIENNDQLIHLKPNDDPWPNTDEGRILLQNNTAVLNNIVGNTAYDIGHVYHIACTDVGGVAYLGSICNNSLKGGGVTCFYTNLITITVQVAAHEVGHQFSATHTFNNCAGNESESTAFEPGSGSTIMSYGGLCGSNNVQGNNDDYYHNASLQQIYNYLRTAGTNAYTCAEKIQTENIPPVITKVPESGFFIPASTPFYLKGQAIDENGDNLSYTWEQMNIGPQSSLGNPIGNAPLFRSYRPSSSSVRVIPAPSVLFSTGNHSREVLPTSNRRIDFNFTVRDNHPNAGTATWEGMHFFSTADAGPFRLRTPNSGLFEAGKTTEVTWDVNNTNVEPVNCQFVDIYLSLEESIFDDSPNFIPLALKVPNNGSHEVVIPPVTSSRARIVIAAHDNIFFTVSAFAMTIAESQEPRIFVGMDKFNDDLCLPAESSLQVNTQGLGGFEGEIELIIEDLPQQAEASISQETIMAGDNVRIDFMIPNEVTSGIYPVKIKATSELGDTLSYIYTMVVQSTNFSEFLITGPEDGASGVNALPEFSWLPSFNAEAYEIRISDNPSFDEGAFLIERVLSNSTFQPSSMLANGTVYYWQVRALNSCAVSEYSPIRAFITVALNCSSFSYEGDNIQISAGPPNNREIVLEVPVGGGVLNSVNVPNLHIQHQNFRDLRLSLLSPKGTQAVLVNRQCQGNRTFSAGFSDEAPVAFNCLFNEPFFRPQQPLSIFQGEEFQGEWTLLIEDLEVQNGGSFRGLSLEFCTSVSLNPPILVVNDTLKIPPGDRAVINASNLLTSHSISPASQIVYTLVSYPEFGFIALNNQPIEIGAKFTQDDINNNRLRYINESDTESDLFQFVVEDGDGGWISITNFNILVSDDFTSSVTDLSAILDWNIYPVPTTDFLKVEFFGIEKKEMDYRIFDQMGKLVQMDIIAASDAIFTGKLNAGMYYIQLYSNEKTDTKKFIIAR
jgi:subtilisin-like proprotein convertase family protein